MLVVRSMCSVAVVAVVALPGSPPEVTPAVEAVVLAQQDSLYSPHSQLAAVAPYSFYSVSPSLSSTSPFSLALSTTTCLFSSAPLSSVSPISFVLLSAAFPTSFVLQASVCRLVFVRLVFSPCFCQVFCCCEGLVLLLVGLWILLGSLVLGSVEGFCLE